MKKYNYKKGKKEKALKEAMKKHASSGEVDWTPLRGTLKSELSSIELQHFARRKAD